MKFPKMRFTNREKQVISNFSRQDAENGSAVIASAVNTEFSLGTVRTRRSVVATGDMVCTVENAKEQSFAFTGALRRTESGVSELTYLLKTNEDGSKTCSFRFFGSDGSVLQAGKIEYPLDNNMLRRRPEGLVCFSSVPKYGAGIYAFIKVFELETNKYTLDIFELSDDATRWISITGSDFYVPTHLWGGRGDNWNMCETALAEPEIREELNMLGGVCDCYFTTDGVSLNYTLPPMGYDIETDEYITAAVRVDRLTTLTFKINRHSIISNTQRYQEKDIQMVFTGDSLYFVSGNQQYIMPRYYPKANNMKVRIVHSSESEREWFTGVHTAVTHSFASGGDRLILTNNSDISAGLAVSAENNPFYFPKNNFITVGDGGKINAVCPQKSELLVFKSTEIYKLGIKSGRLQTERLTGEVGAVNHRAVKTVGGACCFISSNDKPYAVYGDRVHPLHSALGENVELLLGGNVFACTAFGRYIVFCDKAALLLEVSDGVEAYKNPCWNVWTFPFNSRFEGSVSYGDDCTIIGRSNVLGVTYYYVAKLCEGQGDMCYPFSSVRLEKMLYPIKTTIKTAALSPASGEFFSLDSLELQLVGLGDCEVSIKDQSGDIRRRFIININNGRRGCPKRLLPNLLARECAIELSSEEQIILTELRLGYHKLSE